MNDLTRALKVYTDQARDGLDMAEESARANDVHHVADVLDTLSTSLAKASATIRGLTQNPRWENSR